MPALRMVGSIVGCLAVALWLGGIVALGALVAPIVFTRVSMPQSADAMTLVFRRFDLMAMSCAAAALAAEALRAARAPLARLDRVRVGVLVLAAIAAVYEGTNVSPRIADLHASGAIRGVGIAGVELAKLHDVAEACGKAQLVLLVAVVALQVVTMTRTVATSSA
jgi:hypothetical protein